MESLLNWENHGLWAQGALTSVMQDTNSYELRKSSLSDEFSDVHWHMAWHILTLWILSNMALWVVVLLWGLEFYILSCLSYSNHTVGTCIFSFKHTGNQEPKWLSSSIDVKAVPMGLESDRNDRRLDALTTWSRVSCKESTHGIQGIDQWIKPMGWDHLRWRECLHYLQCCRNRTYDIIRGTESDDAFYLLKQCEGPKCGWLRPCLVGIFRPKSTTLWNTSSQKNVGIPTALTETLPHKNYPSVHSWGYSEQWMLSTSTFFTGAEYFAEPLSAQLTAVRWKQKGDH